MATIVIRSLTKEKISGTCCYEWSVTEAHRNSKGELFMRSKLVNRFKARQIIARHGLVESYTQKEGQIFDTPAGDFKALFPNGIETKEDKEAIRKTDNII